MNRLCRFCKRECFDERPDGTLVPKQAIVPYMGGWLHADCWGNLVRIAAKTGGAL